MSASPRSRLLTQLAVAAELEHGLCLQYLFTAASLKNALGEGGLTPAELTAVRKWKANLYFIAAQEMLHLMQVANLAAAAGGALQLDRPNFPQRPSYYPTDLPWGLWPFSAEAIKLYAYYERPDDWHDEPGDWPADPIPAGQFDGLLAEAPEDKDPFAHLPDRFDRPRTTAHETIADLYAAIGELFDEPGMIVGDPRQQVPAAIVDLPELVEIDSRDDARRAIELIVEQGEGAPADRDDSHFGMFLAIDAEHARLSAQRPEFAPARDVQSNPLSRLHADNTYPGWRLIEDPRTREVNDLSNAVYRLLLSLLGRLAAPPSERLPRPALAQASLRLMTAAVKPLCELLTTLPMGDPSPSRAGFAGASFELDHRVPAIPEQGLGEELEALAAWADSLGLTAPADTLRDIATGVGGHVSRSP